MAVRKPPHACGEYTGAIILHQNIQETPPRMWGIPYRVACASSPGRNTPTHVGNTTLIPMGTKEDPETPPRMWGRLNTTAVKQTTTRNTPTHVGKTSRSSLMIPSAQKHPHACGEDLCEQHSGYFIEEPPPRMWGRLRMVSGMHCHGGNTPTHVGKTNACEGWGAYSGNTPTHVGKTPAYCVQRRIKTPDLR